MKRDIRGSMAFWDKWTTFTLNSIDDRLKRLAAPSGNPTYEPQYVYELAHKHLKLMLRRYSRGDAIGELAQHFGGLLDAWEESERLGAGVWTEETQFTRNSWTVNLDHYIDCFWLTGLAITLNIPDEQWQRLLALMGNEGEDALLDRVIAFRQPGRKIGEKLCFPKAYKYLLDVVEATPERRPEKLRAYLEHWYFKLKNAGSRSFPPDFRTPTWYTFGDWNFEGGLYFGRWCIEAVAVATVFNIDDRLCLDHPNYPGDLRKDNRCPRYPDPEPALPPPLPPPRERSWLSRLLEKK
jgi:hypothetical protein